LKLGCYYNGRGVTQGNDQYNLGICYYNGRGVTQDYSQAVNYYLLSAKQENMMPEISLVETPNTQNDILMNTA